LCASSFAPPPSFLFLARRPPCSALFPYTTLFRSILGKLLPYALVGLVDVCLVLGIAVLWFQVPLRGSVALLFAMTIVYLLTTLGDRKSTRLNSSHDQTP